MRARCVLGCFAVLGTILIILGVLTVLFFDDLVSFFIHKEMVLCKSCKTFKMWKKPPVDPRTKIYFFNVTNYDDVLYRKGKPILEEIGPFTYSEEWERENVSFSDDGRTVSFVMRKEFRFRRDLSVADDDTVITTANVPLITALHTVRHGKKLIRKSIGAFAKALDMKILTRKTVKELMWGYSDPLLDLAQEAMPDAAPFSQFGFFYGRNGTDKENVFTMYTGKGDISKLSLLKYVNGNSTLDKWAAPSCNMINGSDGSGFPPGTTRDMVLYLFQPQMCRSLPLVYQKDVVHQDILSLRFAPPLDVFGTVEENPDNACFCLEPNHCTDHGLFNASICMFGAPILLSWPHFYNADPKYLESVEGLNPDQSKHEFYMDIQPRVSMSLQARARMQLNVVIDPMEDIPITSTVAEVVLPVLWFQSGVDRMPDKVLDLIRQATVMPRIAEAGATYSLFILGGVMLVVVFFFILRLRTNQKHSKVELNAMTTNGIHNMTMELNNSTRPNHIYPEGKPAID